MTVGKFFFERKSITMITEKTRGGSWLRRQAFLLVCCLPASIASLSAAECFPVPPGLVAWWPGDTNATDIIGGNNGPTNGITVTSGQVGQAFLFDGTKCLQIADGPALDPTNALTLEGWVYADSLPSSDVQSIVTKETQGLTIQYQLTLFNNGGRVSFLPLIQVPAGYVYFPGATTVQTGTWYHVAMTYDGSFLRLYVNGLIDGSTNATGPLSTGPQPLTMGCVSGGWFFNGKIDELGLYDRALDASEIQGVFGAGSAGKCRAAAAPVIVLQPTNQLAFAGGTATLATVVDGTTPMSYQWLFNGQSLPGATSNVLQLANIQFSQAGDYVLTVTNAYGFALSSNATLTVTGPPPCAAPPTGLVAWWPGDSNAVDIVGNNNGVNQSAVTAGEVGEAFVFSGSNCVQVQDSPALDLTNALTLEGWFYASSLPASDVVSMVTKLTQGLTPAYQLTLYN
jgi:hypothetical protein